MTDHRQVLSVLVPAFNESKTIENVLRMLLLLDDLLKEIVVVDDGSQDGTADIAEALSLQYPQIRVYRLPKNQGKTAAVSFAIEKAQGEIIVIQDADLEYDPAEIPEVIAPILRGAADVVFGSRFMVRRASRVLYYYHFLANKFLTFLSNLLTNRNMTDIETCYKAFRSGVIKPMTLTSKGFGMEVEITALVCKTNARTFEVPISYYGRTYHEGKKIGLRDGLAAIFYIGWYNLLSPRGKKGRKYIQQVNQFLEETLSFPSEQQHAEPTAESRPQNVNVGSANAENSSEMDEVGVTEISSIGPVPVSGLADQWNSPALTENSASTGDGVLSEERVLPED